MCTTCGCGEHNHTHMHAHVDENGNVTTHVAHDHDHEHRHDHANGHHHDHDHGPAHSHAPTTSASRAISIEEDILGRNNAIAARQQEVLPRTPRARAQSCLVARFGQDRASRSDAQEGLGLSHGRDRGRPADCERRRAHTRHGRASPADQHGQGLPPRRRYGEPRARAPCARRRVRALHRERRQPRLPAEFDLGEAHKVVLLSVTEGEDKPLKYPDMFRAADLMILTKTDPSALRPV